MNTRAHDPSARAVAGLLPPRPGEGGFNAASLPNVSPKGGGTRRVWKADTCPTSERQFAGTHPVPQQAMAKSPSALQAGVAPGPRPNFFTTSLKISEMWTGLLYLNPVPSFAWRLEGWE